MARTGLRLDESAISGFTILALLLIAVGFLAGWLSGDPFDDFVLILVAIILAIAVAATWLSGSPFAKPFLLLLLFWAGLMGFHYVFG